MIAATQRLLVVDDERDVITGFRRVFEKDEIAIDAAHSGEEALALIDQTPPDVVLMDLRMPGLDGLATLKRLQSIQPRPLVILMTAFSTSATVIEAMKHGAYDYIVKPFSVEKLREVVFGALKVAHDTRNVVHYEPALQEEQLGDAIIGKSEPMQAVFKTVGQVAVSSATVLVTGESGTGKELVARAIYSHSERSRKPFVPVNCAAIPETLLESELFGHERGAFTNATARRVGKFEMAHQGTLFLDEIGDMSVATQTKILRVLQSGEFERIGGTETVRVDVRIIAATNRDLEAMMRDGTFRSDLYYRLNVVRVELPPLRKRREDVPLLIEHFLRRFHRDREKHLQISNAAMEKLTAHTWPGNVRELENTIRNAILTAKSETLLAADIRLREQPGPTPEPPAPTTPPKPEPDPKPVIEDPEFEDIDGMIEPIFESLVAARSRGVRYSTFDVVERALLVHALNQTSGNQLRAAQLLGITRSTLRKRIARYELQLYTRVRRSL